MQPTHATPAPAPAPRADLPAELGLTAPTVAAPAPAGHATGAPVQPLDVLADISGVGLDTVTVGRSAADTQNG